MILTQEMTEELVSGLREIFGEDIRQIILYGSTARNEALPDSDVDIAIIIEEPITVKKRARFMAFAADMDLKYDRVFSIIDIEQRRMEEWGEILPFYNIIRREGVVLWKTA